MTPFKRWLRNTLERALRRFYEGPEAPPRLREMVLVFAECHPHATRAEWVEFVVEHAAECYRSGYMRGLEWVERDLERRVPSGQPEALMDEVDPEWRWAPEVMLHDPQRVVEEEPPPEHVAIKDQLDRLFRR